MKNFIFRFTTSVVVFAALLTATPLFADEAKPASGAPSVPPTGASPSDVKGSIKMAKVHFLEPKDGATVKQTFRAKFAVEGLKVAPAGEITPGTGHFHIIIDEPAVAEGVVVGMDDKHIHYGKGQTEADLTLKPGKHKLTLQFADGAHRAYGANLSQTITVTVK